MARRGEPRIVVSLATVPWRDTAEKAIEAWRAFADIVITRARKADRGPVEKYLAGDRELPPSDVVIVCDDDYAYPRSLLDALLAGLEAAPPRTVVQGRRGGFILAGDDPRLCEVKARTEPAEINIVGGGCGLAFRRRDFEQVRAELARGKYYGPERWSDDYTASRAIARMGLSALALPLGTPRSFPCGSDPRSLCARDNGVERVLALARRDKSRWWRVGEVEIMAKKKAAKTKEKKAQAARERGTNLDSLQERIARATSEALRHGRRDPGAAVLAGLEYLRATRDGD